MKILVTRAVGILLLLFTFLIQPEAMWPIGKVAWATVASVLFAGAMIYFTGKCRVYVLSTVAIVTVVFPLVVLFAIGQPTYGSTHLVAQFAEFTSKLVSGLSGNYIQAAAAFFLPTIACMASLRLFERIAPSHSERLHASA